MEAHVSGHAGAHAPTQWGDYNARPLPESELAPIPPLALALFGLTLALVLTALFIASLRVAAAPDNVPLTPARHAH